jgi:tetracycline resistance efflux pump
MNNYGWLSLLPPMFAIGFAIVTKQVLLSLFMSIWVGSAILVGGDPLQGFIEAINACLAAFSDPGNTKVIVFCALVGALIALMQRSGGVDGFVIWISHLGFGKSKTRAQLLAWFIGVFVFVESSISCLMVGTISRPLFDKLKISREKLSYYCDSTSAPGCMLIPFNGWGAYVISLLAAQNIEQPFYHLMRANMFNFYCFLALLMPLFLCFWQRDFGPMKKAETRTQGGKLFDPDSKPLISGEITALKIAPGIKPKSMNLVVPLLTLITMMPTTLYLTGNGNIMNGSGSTAVFWAVLSAVLVSSIMIVAQRILTVEEVTDTCFKGIAGLIPLAMLVLLALALGTLCAKVGTGLYIAGLAKQILIPELVPAILFIVSCCIGFATGSSWGTFAIMLPIGIPMVEVMHVDLHLVIASVLSGGVFGDHCSPISDTTIVSSMASACDLVDHAKTQLPYGLVAVVGALAMFLVSGWLMV